MKLREILLRLRREYFCSDLSRIHLFIYVIYLFIDAFSVLLLLLLLLFGTFLCTSPAPRGPTLRPLQGLSAYDNTNLIVSLRRLQSACLPSSLLLPFFRLLLLHFLFFLCFFFLLVLSAAVCVMRFQCRRVDFSWRPAKECQYYLSSLVCFSMDRKTDGQCRLFLLFFSLG